VAISTSSSTPTGTYTITITGSGGGLSKTTTYNLEIRPLTYTVNFYVKDDAGNVVNGAIINFDGSSYSNGESATVTSGSHSLASGDMPSGYRFKEWESSGGIIISSPTSISTTISVGGSGSIILKLQRTATVTFSADGLESDALGKVLMVDRSSYGYNDLPVSFNWDVGSSHSFTWFDEISAGTGKRYMWVSTSGMSTSRSGTINVQSGGGSVSATYKTQYTLIIGISPSEGGSTNPPAGTYWYDDGSTINISAIANTNYEFAKWQLDGTDYSTNNPATITMNMPHTLTAYFVEVQTRAYSIDVDNRSFVVTIKSNSIISNVALNKDEKKLSFNIEGPSGAAGICNVTIPKELLNAAKTDWVVLIDGSTPSSLTITWNTTHTFIHFTYTHSIHIVEIRGTKVVPEFTSITVFLSLMLLTILGIFLAKKKNTKHFKPAFKLK
jgi:hypothetical protein